MQLSSVSKNSRLPGYFINTGSCFEQAIIKYKENKTNTGQNTVPQKRKMFGLKKITALLVLGVMIFAASAFVGQAYAAQGDDGLSQSVGDILDSMETGALDELLKEFSEEERAIFGSLSVGEKLKEIVSGKIKLDYGSFFEYFFEIIGISVAKIIPFVLILIGISVAAAFMNAIKGKLASKSVESIISFAFMSIVIILVSTQLMIIITNTSKTILTIQKQMNVVFPIILTLMAAIGSVSSVSVYQPTVAVLSSGIIELIVSLILPMFILSVIFCVVGSISGGAKLGKLADFFSSCIKSLMSGAFFLFLAFLSIQGITASVYDSISIRATKFALNNYIPIIGGYLSEGLNLVMAGSVLIKNAVGMCAILILIITALPMILQIVVFRLSLSFVAAVVEPLGNDALSKMLSQLSKNLKTLVAIMFGLFFLYFVFLLLTICTGNLIL